MTIYGEPLKKHQNMLGLRPSLCYSGRRLSDLEGIASTAPWSSGSDRIPQVSPWPIGLSNQRASTDPNRASPHGFGGSAGVCGRDGSKQERLRGHKGGIHARSSPRSSFRFTGPDPRWVCMFKEEDALEQSIEHTRIVGGWNLLVGRSGGTGRNALRGCKLRR